MAREATISYEQVSAIAERLKANNEKPTLRAIREKHGSGSLGTIRPFLKQWEAGHTRQVETGLALPDALQRSILEFIASEIAQAKSPLETKLNESQQEAADLATENERQAAEIEALNRQIEELHADTANREGRLSILETDLETVKADAARERGAAEAARTELAKALLRLESMPRLESDIREARDAMIETNRAREMAERELAVSRSHVESLDAQIKELKRHSDEFIARVDADKKRLEVELAGAHSDVRSTALELGKVRGELGATQASLKQGKSTGIKNAARKTAVKK
jgi:chromosome segregation ATPase